MPGKGWFTILRLYSPLEPFFTKEWRPSEIELAPMSGAQFAASAHRVPSVVVMRLPWPRRAPRWHSFHLRRRLQRCAQWQKSVGRRTVA